MKDKRILVNGGSPRERTVQKIQRRNNREMNKRKGSRYEKLIVKVNPDHTGIKGRVLDSALDSISYGEWR